MTKEQKILLLFVLLIAGSGVAMYVSKNNTAIPVVSTVPQTNSETNTATKLTTTTEPAPTTSETAVSAIVTATPTPVPAPVVQNKTLVHNQEYIVPDGDTENITVTVILDTTGNIVDVKFAYGTPTNRESKEFLGRFNTAFSAKTLVGTKIGDIKLSRVGGSSLTTGAFNKAMATLATKVTS